MVEGQRRDHDGQVSQDGDVERRSSRWDPTVRKALRQRELSQAATVTHVDLPAGSAPPLEEDRHLLAGQRVKAMGDDQRVNVGRYARRSMPGPS